MTVPLAYGESISGRLECGPRSEGRYRERDRELLMTLARQAALAIHNARLARELRDSRGRIVRAEELGRRRLERDIHDGVQQELVALLAKLRLARDQVGRNPAAVAELLEDVHEETKLAIRDLRAVAQGIHPAVLSDRGLVDAIEERVARIPNSVTIDVNPAMRAHRFPPAVEGAAYFTVCEALSNAMKHAAADHLLVRVAAEDGELSVDVTDDGSGFDTRTVARSGLSGLADRIEALGGRLLVTSAPGKGTQIIVRLPVPSVTRV
jgi:signal transduction histidine kinase